MTIQLIKSLMNNKSAYGSGLICKFSRFTLPQKGMKNRRAYECYACRGLPSFTSDTRTEANSYSIRKHVGTQEIVCRC